MEKKRCTKCNNLYPATNEYFNYRNKTNEELQSQCKTCFRETVKKSRERNGRECLIIDITNKDKKIIENNAKRSGLDISKYIRYVAIKNQPIIIKDIGNLEAVETKIGNLEYEIKKLGNNINQIAKVLNEGNTVPGATINSLLEVLKRLDSRMEKINKVLAKSYDEIYK